MTDAPRDEAAEFDAFCAALRDSMERAHELVTEAKQVIGNAPPQPAPKVVTPLT